MISTFNRIYIDYLLVLKFSASTFIHLWRDTVQTWKITLDSDKMTKIQKDYFVYYSLFYWKQSRLPKPNWVKENFGEKVTGSTATSTTPADFSNPGWTVIDFNDSD